MAPDVPDKRKSFSASSSIMRSSQVQYISPASKTLWLDMMSTSSKQIMTQNAPQIINQGWIKQQTQNSLWVTPTDHGDRGEYSDHICSNSYPIIQGRAHKHDGLIKESSFWTPQHRIFPRVPVSRIPGAGRRLPGAGAGVTCSQLRAVDWHLLTPSQTL